MTISETLKNRLLIILGIACVALLFTSISSCGTAQRQKSSRDKEMLLRLDLEEKMSKAGQERQASEKKLSALIEELAQEKTSLAAVKKQLLQEQVVSQSLKDELLKVTKLNAKLEEDLKAALAAKAAQPKK